MELPLMELHSVESIELHSKRFNQKRLVKSVKLLPLNIKLINPVQKYPHITESYACILQIFAIMLLLLIDF